YADLAPLPAFSLAGTGSLVLIRQLLPIQTRKLIELSLDIVLNLVITTKVRQLYRVLRVVILRDAVQELLLTGCFLGLCLGDPHQDLSSLRSPWIVRLRLVQ